MSGNNTSTGAGIGMTTQGGPGQGGQGGQVIGGFGTTTAGTQISTTAVTSTQSVHATGLFATNTQPAQATGQAVPGIVPFSFGQAAQASKLPNEVIQVVINHPEQAKQLSTLASLLCTSRAAYNAVAPTFYDEVVITRKNARGVFLGLHKGVPLARQAKRVKLITWERFKHPDHDREFEDTARRWAAGNRKKSYSQLDLSCSGSLQTHVWLVLTQSLPNLLSSMCML